MIPFWPARRRFLALAGYALAGGATYTYLRGLRFSPLDFVGGGPTTAWQAGGTGVSAKGAFFRTMTDNAFHFRAFVPEPAFAVRSEGPSAVHVLVENLHLDASLEVGAGNPASLDEQRNNLARTVSFELSGRSGAEFSWRFPKREQYRFAAIGDSGGGTELRWALKRAAQLGADFLVHLGDFYYETGDLMRASDNLRDARIPTYSAIGNHDFNDNRHAEFSRFHRLIGPSNFVFRLGGVEFLSFDTAAAFWPVDRGTRGQILKSLSPIGSNPAVRDRVALTHKPLRDPDPKRHHAVDAAEARWLRERLLAAGTRNLLVGHIHITDEFDDRGLHTYVSGQGLGHGDLMFGHAYADILLGDVEPGRPVAYHWQPLKMPFDWHCNRRNFAVLDALKRTQQKARLTTVCAKV